MNLLVLGGNGFIGRWLRRSYEQLFVVSAPDRMQLDLVDRAAVGKWLRDFSPDLVIHSASQSDHRMAASRPDFVKHNVLMVMNVIDQLSADVPCVWIGSGAIYGRDGGIRNVTESSFASRLPFVDLDFSRGIISRLAAQHSNVIELRPFGVYGPGEDWRIRFISFAVCRALHGLPIVIRQDRRMSYVHVEDLCHVLTKIIQNPRLFSGAYNVSDGVPINLSEIAKIVGRETGSNLNIEFESQGMGPEYTCSQEKISGACPTWMARSIDEGVRGLVEWYRSHLEDIPISEISVIR